MARFRQKNIRVFSESEGGLKKTGLEIADAGA